ncbi:MAG: helix-turn-helix domain-containing protein [Flavobacteriia bacterium]
MKDIVFVGTTKESLVRMLSEFKREGIIRSEGREIVIMDEARLKRTAIGF